MQYAKLGNTGLIVSRLSYGVMTFGSAPESDPGSSVWKTGQGEAAFNRLLCERLAATLSEYIAALQAAASSPDEG